MAPKPRRTFAGVRFRLNMARQIVARADDDDDVSGARGGHFWTTRRPARSTGRGFAHSPADMPRKRSTIDERPGPLPAIRIDGQSVIFDMLVKDEDSCLGPRCDPDGSVWVSIVKRQAAGEWWGTP